jgi:TIR domain-containing protein
MVPTTKRWDVFISHASEDKEAVAMPLTKALEGAGVKVWLDQDRLRIGDSLRASIDEGLAESRFGVVIISAAFLGKQWPARELNGLMTLEEDGHKVILPIWHGVTKSQVAEHSPILADRLAADTKRGVAYVARAIEDVVFDPKNGSPSAETPSVGRRFIELLDATPSISTIRTFLIAHRAVLLQAYAVFHESFWLEAGDGSKGFDLCVKIQGPSRPVISQFLVFLPPSEKPFLGGFPTLSLIRSVSALHHLVERSNLSKGTVVVGRRDNLSDDERTLLKDYNASLSGVTVHTYDWLIDLAMNLNDWAITEARRLDDWSTAHDYEGFKNPTKAESEPN